MTQNGSRGTRKLGIRWTIGDVNPYGFEALRLSVWGAWHVFGPEASFLICVNTIPVDIARRRVGTLPDGVAWHSRSAKLPGFLQPYLSPDMAEGTAWKFSPLRVFADRHALVLDNDVILWDLPEGIRRWLEAEDIGRCVIAEDVRRCFGQFDSMCGPEPRNAGIIGLPPGFDYEAALAEVLREKPVLMISEQDEQGLQVAALCRHSEPLIVTTEEVTICSPFPPHMSYLGRCGAHFVGLNTKHIPWSLNGRSATEYIREHWERHRGTIYEKIGIAPEHPVPAGLSGNVGYRTEPDSNQHSHLTP